MIKVKIPEDISKLSFEEAMSELEEIVKDLESGQVNLDESVKFYERGSLIMRHCESKLSDARMKVEKITNIGDEKKTKDLD